MIVEIGGGQSGFKEYLETGQKKGRDMHRNQLDQRIPLFGDLDVFEIATSTHQGDGQRYDHITLSFSENHVPDEMLQRAVNDFRDHALAAWPEAERHRIAFYAEAHRPKVLGYTNSETGEHVDRYTHIHIGMGRRDLLTGKCIEPLGYLGAESSNLKFIDAWQESFNARHGFASPKDNPKITPENAVDVLARYSGTRPDVLGTFNQRKAALEISLQKEVIEQNITTWTGFAKLLEEHGVVSVMHKGQFNECYRVKPSGSDKAMRLSGIFFQRDFIERPTDEKLSIISAKAKVAYLEQMQPRKAPEYITAALDEWRTFKAREHRYLHTGSKFYNDVYKPADAQTRLHLLNKLEKEHHAKPSPVSDNRRKTIATTRNCVPGMPARDMDGIQKGSEMLLRRDHGVDVRVEPIAGQEHFGMRQADEGRWVGSVSPSNSTSQSEGTASDEANRERSTSQSVHRLGVISLHRELGAAGARQPSSVIERHLADLRERYEQASDKGRYVEIRKCLDCRQLLNSLSHSHGLNPDVFLVVEAKDGTPRIQCGSRSLTPSDFLMKELGLPWKEAAPILRRTYEQQIKSEITKPRGKGGSTKLWKEFQDEQQVVKLEMSKRLKVFNELAKARRNALSLKLKSEQQIALAGLSGAARKAAHSLEKLRATAMKTELNILLKQERQVVRTSIQSQDAWPLFLQVRAQAGDIAAITTLRKLDATARKAKTITPSISGNHIHSSAVVTLKYLVHVVEHNGDVLYYLNGRFILRDEGNRIAILDEQSEQAIISGLLIAREKFGITLNLTGPSDFQQRVVDLAVSRGIAVKFSDPALEEMRLRLVEEKRRAMTIHKPQPLVPSNQPAQPEQAQSSDSPAVEPTTEQPVEVEPMPQPLTAAEWIATQRKRELGPHQTGDASVLYEVAYVASDGLVINHGRGIATYPLPVNVEICAGQKIVIDKSGRVVFPHSKAEVEGGRGRDD